MSEQAAWFQLFERSLRAEEKQNYRNIKGKEYFFADFVLHHLKQFKYPAEQALIFNRLQNIFMLYPLAAVSERRQYLTETRNLLERLHPPKPKPRSKPQKPAPKTLGPLAQADADWHDVPVQFVKGVGPKLGEKFAQVGVGTVSELLQYFPRKHLDYSQSVPIRELRAGERATVFGVIYRVSHYSPPGKKQLQILKLTIRDGTGRLYISFFQRGRSAYLQRQMRSRFPEGARILLSGLVKWDQYSKGLTLDSPEFEVLGADEDLDRSDSLHLGRIVPVYPLTEGLNVKWVRQAIFNALERFCPRIQDPIPLDLRQRLNLPEYAQALREYHFPSSADNLEIARQRLVFQELFLTQLGLLLRRKQREAREAGKVLHSSGSLAQRFLAALPFALTGAQQRVYREILGDLHRSEPMSRLVQGDVGSGKTVVAVLALLEAIECGYQGALMAPTEILAEQHFQKLFAWLLPLGLQVELLTGSQKAKTRREAQARLASGEAALAVGTHALIQEGVDFHKLGLVVIDEQHRFGVKQRSALRDKGQHPEILTMTATPIPRTLALTLYGDLEVSLIDELPPGRKPVETQLLKGSQRQQLWHFMRQELDTGRQAYVVFPLVEESEKMDLRAATVEFERYRDEVFPEFQVGLLHGKMKGPEKEAVMRAFVANEIQILVATTVIEVGVDVPNASVMVIEHAERFGLSQLHQLRGRVGRGADRAWCYLVADKLSEQAKDRLQVFTRTNDGFVIAEQDLRLRGPGEFLGTRQSGLPDMVLSNLAEDTEILEAARGEAKLLLEADPNLQLAENRLLRQELFRHFRHHLGFLEA